MALQQIKNELPDFYNAFLSDFFDKEIPVEVFSTCANCAMACHDESKRKAGKKYFSDEVKCCTYFPKIPNYLVGAILSDINPASDEGRKRIRQKIRNKTGVSPAGIYPPKIYEQLYLKEHENFGKSKALLCPYFDEVKRNCTIWKFREAACTTYFCKQVGGNSGKAFWSSLSNYLLYMQSTLVNHTLSGTGYSTHDILTVFPSLSINHDPSISEEELQGFPAGEEKYKELWRHNHGREEEFYIHAFETVRKLDRMNLSNLTGNNGEILLKDLENKWNHLMQIPQLLKINPVVRLEENANGQVPVFFYDLDTTFAIPSLIFQQFNGQNTLSDISDILLEKAGIEIDEEFILPFYQRGILIAENPISNT